MAITTNIKNGIEFVGETITEIANSLAEKNRLRVQLNHIKGLIKEDSATRDQAFIELGRYFYENLREDTTAENEAICAVIDAANDRISKASLRYVELLNIQNETKIRSENAEKIAKIVSEKATATAKAAKEKGAVAFDKAKATATDLKDKALDKAGDLRARFDPNKNEDLEELIAAEEARIEAAEDTVADAADAVTEAKDTAETAAAEAPTAADVVEAATQAVIPETTDEESPEDAGF